MEKLTRRGFFGRFVVGAATVAVAPQMLANGPDAKIASSDSYTKNDPTKLNNGDIWYDNQLITSNIKVKINGVNYRLPLSTV